MLHKPIDAVEDMNIEQLVKSARDIKESISRKEQEIDQKQSELAQLKLNSIHIADALRKFASSLDGGDGPAVNRVKSGPKVKKEIKSIEDLKGQGRWGADRVEYLINWGAAHKLKTPAEIVSKFNAEIMGGKMSDASMDSKIALIKEFQKTVR